MYKSLVANELTTHQDVLLQVRVPDQEMRRVLSAAEEQGVWQRALDF